MNTISTIGSKFQDSVKIIMLTAYDTIYARLIDAMGVDIVLVGDSLGMVMRGESNTLNVTVEDMVYHTKMVRNGINQALLVADLPFLSYQISPETALFNAGQLIAKGGAAAVKLEGGMPYISTIVKIIEAGIPVMGHLGFTPQAINQIGGYKIQGNSADSAKRLLAEAKALEACGIFALVLEMVPAEVAKEIQENLRIPVIGCGAGPYCAGQVVVTHDLLGLYPKAPKFVKQYANLSNSISQAIGEYINDIHSGVFPGIENSY